MPYCRRDRTDNGSEGHEDEVAKRVAAHPANMTLEVEGMLEEVTYRDATAIIFVNGQSNKYSLISLKKWKNFR